MGGHGPATAPEKLFPLDAGSKLTGEEAESGMERVMVLLMAARLDCPQVILLDGY
jgi:hypothetical protein